MRASIAVLCALAALLPAPAAAGQSPAGCPKTLDGKPLQSVALFDGPPAEMAELAPEQRGRADRWTGLGEGGRPVFLVCRYTGTTRTLERTLPKSVRTCTGERTRDGKGYGRLDCTAAP